MTQKISQLVKEWTKRGQANALLFFSVPPKEFWTGNPRQVDREKRNKVWGLYAERVMEQLADLPE